MEQDRKPQLSSILDHENSRTVFSTCCDLLRFWHKDLDYPLIESCFKSIEELFSGQLPGYRACNTEYHNLHHTTDVMIAATRLLDGFYLANGSFSREDSENLLLAAIFHDTGYLQKAGDLEGTGAKYTSCHVQRSREFTLENASSLGLGQGRAEELGRLIECTNLISLPEHIDFPTPAAQDLGRCLATADLLGQMADRAYLEKLLFLYYEFREAGFPGYSTEFDILKNTLGFYEKTRDRLERGLLDYSKYAHTYFFARYNIDSNLYLDSISGQMDYLRSIIEDNSCNFRKKLHRINLEGIKAS